MGKTTCFTVAKWTLVVIVLFLFFFRCDGRHVGPLLWEKRDDRRDDKRVCGLNLVELTRAVCESYFHSTPPPKRSGISKFFYSSLCLSHSLTCLSLFPSCSLWGRVLQSNSGRSNCPIASLWSRHDSRVEKTPIGVVQQLAHRFVKWVLQETLLSQWDDCLLQWQGWIQFNAWHKQHDINMAT